MKHHNWYEAIDINKEIFKFLNHTRYDGKKDKDGNIIRGEKLQDLNTKKGVLTNIFLTYNGVLDEINQLYKSNQDKPAKLKVVDYFKNKKIIGKFVIDLNKLTKQNILSIRYSSNNRTVKDFQIYKFQRMLKSFIIR